MISRLTVFTLLGAMLITTQVFAQQRLPTIPPDQYTAEQKKASEEFLAARKVPVFGPFEPNDVQPRRHDPGSLDG
jgi:4-carboxymuconolactone decarboxylase